MAHALANVRDRAAYALEASPMLRYTLEFFLANAIAAWGGSEGQYDRLQDNRIEEVARRLESMQLGTYGRHGGGPAGANADIISYTPMQAARPESGDKARMVDSNRNRHGQILPAGAANAEDEWDQQQYSGRSEGTTPTWVSWSVAVGAITCSGTTCMWRFKVARSRSGNGREYHDAPDQAEGEEAAQADQGRRDAESARRRGRHQSVQRHHPLRQRRKDASSKAKKSRKGKQGGEDGRNDERSGMQEGDDAVVAEDGPEGASRSQHLPLTAAAALCSSNPQCQRKPGIQNMQRAVPVAVPEPAQDAHAEEETCHVQERSDEGALCTVRAHTALQCAEKAGFTGSTYGVQTADGMHANTVSSSNAIISRRVLQFSMLAEAISGSDDAKLAELALQLHTPLAKLRQWEANWNRISGQRQMCEAATADSERAGRRSRGYQPMDAIEAGDEPLGAHGKWELSKCGSP